MLGKGFVFFLLLCGAGRACAQENGAIEGRVKDGQNHLLRAATVRLVDIYDLMPAKTVQSDTAGEFYIDGIPFGLYNCTVTQAGMKPLVVDCIPITPHCGTINLGNLVLVPAGKLLAGVVVF